MTKKTVRDIDLANKRVLVRVDFNVPLKDGRVSDDSRIKSGSSHHPVSAGAELPRDPHVAPRPAQRRSGLRLATRPGGHAPGPAAASPGAQGGRTVRCWGGSRRRAMQPGDVLLLENSRFDPREKKNDPELGARSWPVWAMCSSTTPSAPRTGLTSPPPGWRACFPRWPGFSMEKEVDGARGAPGRARSDRSWSSWAAPRSPTRSRSSTASSSWPTAADRRRHEHHLPQGAGTSSRSEQGRRGGPGPRR